MDPIQFPAATPVATPAAPAAPARTKPPYRVVRSDDCTQTVDGVVYYPHAGESVAFVASIRLDTLLMAMKLQSLQGMDMSQMSPEDGRDFAQMFAEVCLELAQCIRDFNWTSDEVGEDGEYIRLEWSKDPDEETRIRQRVATLKTRSMDEIMWLVGAAFGGGTAAEPAGNATGA